MVGEIGIDPAVDAPGFEPRRKQAERIHVPASPVNGMQTESLALYVFTAGVDARRDVNFISGTSRRARHRKPVRDEIPVFGNQIENLTRHRTYRRIALWIPSHRPGQRKPRCSRRLARGDFLVAAHAFANT